MDQLGSTVFFLSLLTFLGAFIVMFVRNNFGWSAWIAAISLLGIATTAPVVKNEIDNKDASQSRATESSVTHNISDSQTDNELITAIAVDNDACWGDSSRVDISCTALTERMLVGLSFASYDQVAGIMKAKGRPLSIDNPNTMHFISNAGRGGPGSGILNITFRHGQAVAIQAFIDRPQGHLEYIWNSELGGCSDFPGSAEKCSG